jgi:hypothetical protein
MKFNFEAIADGKELAVSQAPNTNQPTLESVSLALKESYSARLDSLLSIAQAHEVKDDESEKKAIEMAGQAKTLLNSLDAERRESIKEPDAFVRGVNKLCKVFKDKIATIQSDLKKKVGDFQWRKELDRRKREKEAREAAEKLQKQVEKEAKEAGVEAPVVAPAPVEKKETVTRTDSGASAHIRTAWKMTEITDFSAVPDKYKMLDERAVKIAIQGGATNIPGLKIEEVATTVLRA